MKTRTIRWALTLSLVALIGACSSNRKEQRKANSYLDDKVTAARVENTLHAHTGYTFPNAHATATNGVVYLTGNVETEQEKNLAEELARSLHRTRDVRNALVVKH